MAPPPGSSASPVSSLQQTSKRSIKPLDFASHVTKKILPCKPTFSANPASYRQQAPKEPDEPFDPAKNLRVFKVFPNLPIELRLAIWKLALPAQDKRLEITLSACTEEALCRGVDNNWTPESIQGFQEARTPTSLDHVWYLLRFCTKHVRTWGPGQLTSPEDLPLYNRLSEFGVSAACHESREVHISTYPTYALVDNSNSPALEANSRKRIGVLPFRSTDIIRLAIGSFTGRLFNHLALACNDQKPRSRRHPFWREIRSLRVSLVGLYPDTAFQRALDSLQREQICRIIGLCNKLDTLMLSFHDLESRQLEEEAETEALRLFKEDLADSRYSHRLTRSPPSRPKNIVLFQPEFGVFRAATWGMTV